MKKGFTLIELLVVISIIALLSSVVLSSLNAARTKAGDTAVKATLKQMYTQAQNYLDAGNTTLGLGVTTCTTGVFSDTQVTQMIANIQQNAYPGATISCSTSADGSKWGIWVSALKGGGTWCADNSQGWFKPGTSVSSGQCQP